MGPTIAALPSPTWALPIGEPGPHAREVYDLVLAAQLAGLEAVAPGVAGRDADAAARRGYQRLGLTGTRWLVESGVYPGALGARGMECIRPGDADRRECSRIIMEELVYGQFKPGSVAYYQQVIERLKGAGAEAVILGCTEIPLIIDDSNSALPTLDSTRLLARAALNRAVGAA